MYRYVLPYIVQHYMYDSKKLAVIGSNIFYGNEHVVVNFRIVIYFSHKKNIPEDIFHLDLRVSILIKPSRYFSQDERMIFFYLLD